MVQSGSSQTLAKGFNVLHPINMLGFFVCLCVGVFLRIIL